MKKLLLLSTFFTALLTSSLAICQPVRALDCVEASKFVQAGARLHDGSENELSQYRKAIEMCPTMAEAHAALGSAYFRAGKLDDALKELEAAIERKNTGDFQIVKGTVLLSLGRSGDAKEVFEQVLQKEPRRFGALQGLSLVSEKNGDLNAALGFLLKAQEIASTDKTTLFNVAVLRERLAQFSEAAHAFEQVTALDPKDAEAWYLLGRVRMKANQSDLAIPALTKASELEPKNKTYHQILARAFETSGDLDRAELAQRKALLIDPADSDIAVNLASILIKKNQPALAVDVLNPLLTQNGAHAGLHAMLGWAYLDLARDADAERELRRAIELDAGLASARNNLGILLERTGRREQALQAFEDAVRLDPNLVPASENLKRLKGG